MKVKLSKSGVTNNLFQKNENKNFTAVKKKHLYDVYVLVKKI